MATYSYSIKAGWNQALVDLVNIEDIVPSGDVAFYPPEGFSSYQAGQLKVRGDGTEYIAGYGMTVWQFGVLTRKQWEYLSTTYCAGGWSGKVTIYTRTGKTAYARYNAVMHLPQPAELRRRFLYFEDVPIRFTRLEAL